MIYDGTNLNQVMKDHKNWTDFIKTFGYSFTSTNGHMISGSRAIFQGNCDGIKLRNCDLQGACFYNASLIDADFSSSILYGADFSYAICDGANFQKSDLRRANLFRARMDVASFELAHLDGAMAIETSFEGARFTGATVGGAVWQGCTMRVIKDLPHIPNAWPDTGSFIGWKKCHMLPSKMKVEEMGEDADSPEECIVKLEILENAERLSAYSSTKCRCSQAKVLEFQDIVGNHLPDDSVVFSSFAPSFEYKIGQIVRPDSIFCSSRGLECASGIHFFMHREDAVAY